MIMPSVGCTVSSPTTAGTRMTHILIKLATQPFVHLAPQSFALLSDDPATNKSCGLRARVWRSPAQHLAGLSTLARQRLGMGHTDAYFIGYSSVSDEPQLSATYLQNFLARIIPTPPAEMLVAEARGMQAVLRDAPTTYEDVVLYGHSLGGVVIRLALLEMIKRETVAATTSEASPPAPGVDPRWCCSQFDCRHFAKRLALVRSRAKAELDRPGWQVRSPPFRGYEPWLGSIGGGRRLSRNWLAVHKCCRRCGRTPPTSLRRDPI